MGAAVVGFHHVPLVDVEASGLLAPASLVVVLPASLLLVPASGAVAAPASWVVAPASR